MHNLNEGTKSGPEVMTGHMSTEGLRFFRFKGCDPWRLGVPIIHSRKGTQHHPTPCDSWERFLVFKKNTSRIPAPSVRDQ